MKGSKPLTDNEIRLVLSYLSNNRDKALFILGIRTGFRISELLSLKYKDVIEYDSIKEAVTVTKSNMKGSQSSRSVTLHPDAVDALKRLILNEFSLEDRLFPITRMQAHRILNTAFKKAKVTGKATTHSMRKTFAKKVYEALNKDLVNTQKALGHKSISSTINYLSFDQAMIDTAIKAVS